MSTPTPPAADVVVVGCGPVGATLALLLGRAGVSTLVLDRHRDVYPQPRAVAADDEVLRLLTAAGLGDAVATMVPARGARFASASGARLLDVELPGTGTLPGLALYRQPDLERAVREGLARCPRVTLRLGVGVAAIEQDAAGVLVRLEDGGTVTAGYVVACDGARSLLRQQLGVGSGGPGDGQSWLVVDAASQPPDWVARDRVTYVCDPAGAAVAMPTPTGWRLEVLLPDGHPTGPVEAVQARRLSRGRLDAAAHEVERAVVYRFATRTATRWRLGRVLLAGDAAHTMPPFAGQGLAAGLRDAHALAWRLALVVSDATSDALLDGYERERRPHLRRVTALTRLIGTLVTAPPALAPLRDATLRLLGALPLVGARVRSGGVRPQQALARRTWPALPGACDRGGQLVPAAHLRAGVHAVPLDQVLGGRLTLLAVDDDPADHLSPAAALAWRRLGGQTLSLGARDLTAPVVPAGQVLLVRPDLVVAGASRPWALSTVVLGLAARLGAGSPAARTASAPAPSLAPRSPAR